MPTGGAPSLTPAPSPTPQPTQPPIVLQPQAAEVPVGASATIGVQSAIAPLTLNVSSPSVVSANVDPNGQTILLQGKAPGAAIVTIVDERGVRAVLPVRVAYNAGSIAAQAAVQITGDPASPEFVKAVALRTALANVQALAGAQVVASADEISDDAPLGQDDIATVAVPILIQGDNYFSVEGTVQVRVENVAAPAIVPDSLMVSDFPERLTANGVLFTADLKHTQPTRFLYFHYNPPDQPDRRIVLRVQNLSPEPAVLQYISGTGPPSGNEMLTGHEATQTFLRRLVQNEGRIIVVKGNGTLDLAQQLMPAKDVVCGLLQLRVLNGGTVHLTLFAQNASSSPEATLAQTALLGGDESHARGVYSIPEFHYSTLWTLGDPYLELPIGQVPLPNLLHGQALAGDYGVLQSFVVKVQNPTDAPQPIAIYENPRGGRATGTYLIDGVLIQSHQVPPFSRYKIRQYVVPARGFVRITLETIPDAGSSYPLRLVIAPDDGSVAPGAPGSPVY